MLNWTALPFAAPLVTLPLPPLAPPVPSVSAMQSAVFSYYRNVTVPLEMLDGVTFA